MTRNFYLYIGLSIYLILRFILPAKLNIIIKILLSGTFLFASQMHRVYTRFGGTWFSPEFPRIILIIYPWLFAGVGILTIITIIKDIILILKLLLTLILMPFGKKIPVLISPQKVTIFMLVFSFSLSGFGVWQGIKVPNVKVQEVYFDKLPKELDGITMVLIADLHASALNTRPLVQGIVDKTNNLNPDLIVFNGDMVDGTVEKRSDAVDPLRQLEAKYGVYGSTGNHEYYVDHEKWLKKFEELGIKILGNSHENISINGKILTLVGVYDEIGTRMGKRGPDIKAATRGINRDNLTILLEHRPVNAVNNSKHNIDLQLSGHTHGGMVIGLDRVVADRNGGFVSRWYDVGQMKLYVSNGASLWCGFPIRLGVPSEITQFIFRSTE